MATPANAPAVARFGVFVADLASGEVLKNGVKIRLQEQPFQLLAILLEQPGKVVTREDLRQRLWPADTFVDFDRSLNTAASKLREALGDSADSPRYVETLPRRGYRFVAPVEVISEPVEPAPVTEPPARERAGSTRLERYAISSLPVLAALVVGVVLGGMFHWSGSSPQGRVVRFGYTPGISTDSRPVISPDGRHIAYVSAKGKLEIQDLDRQGAREIEGTEGAQHPFWAPGSDRVAFGARHELREASVRGSTARTICRLPHLGVYGGGTWSPDGGMIAFAMFRAGLYQVPAGGGVPAQILAHEHVETPHFLPPGGRGRALLFAAGERGLHQSHTIEILFLEGGQREVVSKALAHWPGPVYSPTGHVLYASAGGDAPQVWALPFSAASARVTGEAFPVTGPGSLGPSVAQDGTLVYLDPGDLQRMLAWRDRSGRKLGTVSGPWPEVLRPSLSPDGRRLAAVLPINGYYDVCVLDLARGITTRLTFDYTSEDHPLWRPGGEQVTFSSWIGGTADIFAVPASGGQEAKGLVVGPEWDFGEDWSPDGRYLVFRRVRADGLGDLWYLRPKAEGLEAVPWQASPDADEVGAKFSPDGRLLAYASNQMGSYEVYVREFPQGGGPWQVSTHGGTQPRWRKDGREIFYVEGDKLMAASVRSSPNFAVSARQELFQGAGRLEGRLHRYEVSADGRRILAADSLDETRKPAVHVVQNWFADFRDARQLAR